jgi:hypothetical protein
MAKTKVVIFCGAGFSAFAGIPLMSTFSDALRSRNVLGGDQEEFDRIQLRCDSLGAFIGGSARNLEQLASILAMLEIDRPYYQFEECQRYKSPQQAMHLITFAMRKMVCPLLPAERVKEWTAPLLHLAKKADLSFVTTNYDLLLEFAAASQGLRIYPTGDIAEACIHENNESSLYFSRRGEHLIPLYKLHGSANWFTGKDKKLQVSNRSLHIGRMGIDPQKEWETDLCPEDRFADLELRDLLDPDPDRRFLMVPPAVTKSSEFAELLNTQWVGASEVMGEADLLWFIGYSFPETDSFMRYFLATSLFTNAAIRQIVVIDPSRAVCRRARAMFRQQSHNEVFRALPVPWHEVKFDHLFDGNIRQAVSYDIVTSHRVESQISQALSIDE